ncbi:MAG: VOC family protein [Chloroflexi bacterium]|nr:VOC family protein [Chloroflexota bacterium]
MLDDAPIYASVPARDIDRAKRWYQEKLGFTPEVDMGPNGAVYKGGRGTRFVLYETLYAGTGKHTIAGWTVSDLDAAVAELRGRGVVFEEYDGTNGPKTEGGVARDDGGAAAWFKDSEDNILNLNELPPGMSLD